MLGVKLSADQLLENERTNCTTTATHYGSVGGGASSCLVAAALPESLSGCMDGTPRPTVALTRCALLLLRQPYAVGGEATYCHVARHTSPGGDVTPCRAD